MDGVVEGLGRRQVRPERLLHDDPGPLDQAGPVQALDHGPGRRWGDAQVVEPPGLPVQPPLGPGHRLGQAGRAVGLRGEVEPGPELLPVRLDDLPPGELLTGRQGELVELGFVEILQRGADDLVLRQQPRMGEPQQAGEELSPGQVAGGPEQHDHVGRELRRLRGRAQLRIVDGDEVGSATALTGHPPGGAVHSTWLRD